MNKSPLVLLVEDDKPIVEILKRTLKENNIDIIVGYDGKEGLKLAVENHPDLILLDIVMPTMDGLTMLKTLRENDWGKTVKVLVITNLSNPVSETEATDLNVEGYIIKSDWRLDEIIGKIKKLLP